MDTQNTESVELPGNAWSYSPDPSVVRDNILAIDSLGAGTQRLARRLYAEMKIRASGFTQKKPIALLLIGGPDSPLDEIVKAIAETWIGIPKMGLPSYTYIETAPFLGAHPAVVATLVGPRQMLGGNSPVLDYGDFASADHIARYGDSYLPLQDIYLDVVSALTDETHPKHQDETLNTLRLEIEEKMEECLNEAEPFRSVFHIDGIEDLVSAGEESVHFLGVLRSILIDSFVSIIGEGMSYFGNSIIILTMRLPDSVDYDPDAPGVPVTVSPVAGETHEDRFNRVLSIAQHTTGGLTKMIGEENIIVIDKRTEQSVMARCDYLLDDIAQRLRDEFEIKIEFSDSFRLFLLDKCRRPDEEDRFPTSRLPYWIRRYVMGELSEIGTERGLSPKMSIKIDAPDPDNAKKRTFVRKRKTEDSFTVEDIQRVFGEDAYTSNPDTDEVKEFRKRFEEILGTKYIAPGQYL